MGMSWRFLRQGQSAANAVASLDGLLNGLKNVARQDPSLHASSYLMWAENAETQLRAHFDDQEPWRGLHTERYWRIRAISDETLRPHPMIEGEVADQELTLETLRKQLLHYQKILTVAADERLFLIDTNALIHGSLFTQVRWSEHVSEKQVRLIMPLIVLDELDGQKNKGNHEAGGVLRELDKLLPAGEALSLTRVRDNVTLQIVDEPTAHERIGNADDEIVHQAGYFASHCSNRITIVTMDRAMRVRAEAARIPVLMLPAELRRAKE